MQCKRCRYFVIFFLLYSFLLAACCPRQDTSSSPNTYRVVSQIHVAYQKDQIVSEGVFSDAEKMQQILLYLRQISPYGTPAEDPENTAGSIFHITLHYSDGSKKVYQQRADRFMRINSGPWKRIDPKKAVKLSQILGTMDSDNPNHNTDTPFFTPAG